MTAATVVVINWNGRGYLQRCLDALLAQELAGGFDVILADNASTDGSAELVRERYPEVRVLDTGGNLGFAGGNNAGIRAATGRHVVLLNNDTRVRPGWLAALVAAADADAMRGAVTSKLVFLDRPGVIQNAGSMLLTDGSGADRGAGEDDGGQYGAGAEVFAMCGAAVLLARPMLEDVGMFDETFFVYYEDTDLSWRMRLRGWSVWYEPAAVVEHVHAGTNVEWSPHFTFHVDRNRLFMILKNAPAGFAARAFAGFAQRSAVMAARSLVRRRPGGSAPPGAPPPPGGEPAPARWRIHMAVVSSLIRHLPEMLRKRRMIRAGRTVDDAVLLRMLYPRALWDARARR